MNKKTIKRRDLLKDIGITTMGIALGCNRIKSEADEPVYYDVMREIKKYKKIDAHGHITLPDEKLTGPWYFPSNNELANIADKYIITKMIISCPMQGDATPEKSRERNNLVIEAVKQYPDKFMGQCFVNPIYQKESLEEIDRCADAGMVALKTMNQVKISDPLFYPIVEKCIELKWIILSHSECRLGIGGYRMKYYAHEPAPLESSVPEDFVDIASRYPEGMFQYAHIFGSTDWEYAAKCLRNSPNVWVDVSASNNEAGQLEFVVRCLGEDRLFFGTDGSYYQSIGRMMASNLTESQKEKIFFKNYNNILRKAGKHVG